MDAPTTLDALASHFDGKIRAFLQTVTTLGDADLDDAVQDVYVRFLKYDLLDRYAADRAAFSSYLYLVCQSVARNRHRTATRRPICQGEGIQDLARLPASVDPLDRDILIAELRARVAARPDVLVIFDRVLQTGQLTKRDAMRLQDAFA